MLFFRTPLLGRSGLKTAWTPWGAAATHPRLRVGDLRSLVGLIDSNLSLRLLKSGRGGSSRPSLLLGLVVLLLTLLLTSP